MLSSIADSLIALAVNNAAIALPLGSIAWWLQRRGAQPFLAHLLWIIVLVKLVTPAFYALPVFESPAPGPASLGFAAPVGTSVGAALGSVGTQSRWYANFDWQHAVVAIWLSGSAVVLIWSVLRACRFNALLRTTSTPASRDVQRAAESLARTLGLGTVPAVMATTANVSPMTWWLGGAKRIYVPLTMLERLDISEINSILGHEIGPIRRGDHVVRWLEWFVSVALWWNPVAWWARRNLRVCEEICCDAFVLAKTRGLRDAYACALVNAIEILSAPTSRPSSLASRIDGGLIERRIEMILSGKSISVTPRWLRRSVVASMALILPLGFGFAQQENSLESVRQWLESGVNSAFLTQEQADIMLRALEATELGLPFTVRADSGESVFILRRQLNGDEENVGIDGEADEAESEKALVLAFAREFFENPESVGKLVEVEIPSGPDPRRVVRVVSPETGEITFVNPEVSGTDAGDTTVTAESVVVRRPDSVEVLRDAVFNQSTEAE